MIFITILNIFIALAVSILLTSYDADKQDKIIALGSNIMLFCIMILGLLIIIY